MKAVLLLWHCIRTSAGPLTGWRSLHIFTWNSMEMRPKKNVFLQRISLLQETNLTGTIKPIFISVHLLSFIQSFFCTCAVFIHSAGAIEQFIILTISVIIYFCVCDYRKQCTTQRVFLAIPVERCYTFSLRTLWHTYFVAMELPMVMSSHCNYLLHQLH